MFGFFVFGVFSGHAVYLPELFPTHVRATAVSFCNGTGRIITSFGPLVAGLLVGVGGNFNYATAGMTCFALLSILAMGLGRETGTTNCRGSRFAARRMLAAVVTIREIYQRPRMRRVVGPGLGMVDDMNWMMWGGLLIWLVVAGIVLWAVVEVVRFRRSRRQK